MPSVCNLCGSHEESSSHLFLACNYVAAIWSWFCSILHFSIDLSSIFSVLKICDKFSNGQLKDVILSYIIHIFWYIWYARNQARFNDKLITIRRAIHLISGSIALIGNISKGQASPSVDEFLILKHFSIEVHPPKAPSIIQVNNHKRLCGWIKVKSDGASRGNPGIAACGGIFRDSSGAI